MKYNFEIGKCYSISNNIMFNGLGKYTVIGRNGNKLLVTEEYEDGIKELNIEVLIDQDNTKYETAIVFGNARISA